jgi:anti-anti-sigma factor
MKHEQNRVSKIARRRHVIVLPGVLDRRNVPCVRRSVLDLLANGVDVRVDMSDVRGIDTSALAMFVECVRVGCDHGATFTVVQPTERALRMIRLNKLDRLLNASFTGKVGTVNTQPRDALEAASP